MKNVNPLSYFQLKPIKGARVSEISEATAAAPVSDDDRINFHIGNPLQDPRLTSAYLRVAFGLDIRKSELNTSSSDLFLEALRWNSEDRQTLDFFIQTIQKSSPYAPRGGYSRYNPSALINSFCSWLENQEEPLHYDTGEHVANREVILASGGISEAIRIFLFVISSRLESRPAHVLNYRCSLSAPVKNIPNLHFEDLDSDEKLAFEQLEEYIANNPGVPIFLLIGDQLEEQTRRKLRLFSLDSPLFFVETNNAPNHLSLAREAKLVQRVIRLLSPAIFHPGLDKLSTVFIAGNTEFLSAFESVHFNLKGTPSASEIEFLSYILNIKLPELQAGTAAKIPEGKPAFYGFGLGVTAETIVSNVADRNEAYLTSLLEKQSMKLERSLTGFNQKASEIEQKIASIWKDLISDEFSSLDAKDLLDQLVRNTGDQDWHQALQRSFLSNFIKHQSQYLPEASIVVSGSSRTALGILGHHCGLSEVVIPDLSWSYEQCFQKTHVVPLTKSLELDVDGFIEKLSELQQNDASWSKRGALVISNPHNATGQIFSENSIKPLITYCLQNNIYVIDDLAYQNVSPVDGLPEIKTARQIVDQLVHLGILDEFQAERLITVHSVSKTDSFAGARLAVVEIREPELRRRFEEINSCIQPNLAAILISYLFYRGSRQDVRTYWHLRNILFDERMSALLEAADQLPDERNPFELKILPPQGSMYPLLRIEQLPPGLSLDWLASSLARQGFGMLPLSTFSRTEQGFETGRKTFRLTLGGKDSAEILQGKTRRLLIVLNRLIAEEEARYNRKELVIRKTVDKNSRAADLSMAWDSISDQIIQISESRQSYQKLVPPNADGSRLQQEFLSDYLPLRLEVFRNRLLDRAAISDELVSMASDLKGNWLPERLGREFGKDSLQRRKDQFKLRSYDRTVHPTQAYSLQAEMALDEIVLALINKQPFPRTGMHKAVRELMKEHLGQNVRITAQDESSEILLDLAALGAAEDYAGLFTDISLPSLLSFWSDWDGSSRPSGQGHRLVGMILMENVRRMTRIINLLRQADPTIQLNPDLMTQINRLPEQNQRFSELLNNITQLTDQLEQRYRGILPFTMDVTPLQRLATQLNLRRDPARVLWQHNDRNERKMLELRQQRRTMLERYFFLNKQLRKQLHALIPSILENRASEDLLREVVSYSDLLKRTLITPRIHQQMISKRDQFAVDTTVFNLDELNTIAGDYGNPGIILALQISMSSNPEALISLDRKFRMQSQQMQRNHPQAALPSIWLIPLFENVDSVGNIPAYLDSVWDYANQSRHTSQTPQERFSEIISEVFIAGSDLSQQISQASSAFMYRKAKYEIQSWLADHGVSESVRIKLGSGEPMQRQGSYYSKLAGTPGMLTSIENKRRFSRNLPAAAQKSVEYAVTPLQGVFLGGDLKTFQSNLSEQLRFLPVSEFVSLLHHVRETQLQHREDLIRASEALTESRLVAHSRSLQELERITIRTNDDFYQAFLDELTENFRLILFGRNEDVVGIHAATYFIGRSMPQIRDRPSSRKTSNSGQGQGQQILANIAEIIPMSEQGSLLRAISHNQSQTAILGINQLSTGLFRALERFSQKSSVGVQHERMITERVLPNLPIYEILNSLRLYQDWRGEFLSKIETAFPAGNSALVALREDMDAMGSYIPLFQQELLRRHGLDVNNFFTAGVFIPDLLPVLRPELAILFQQNIFNTDIDIMLTNVTGKVSNQWRAEVEKLLKQPDEIRYWRSIIWEAMGDSIYQRVQSFSELAIALHSLSTTQYAGGQQVILRENKLPPTLENFFSSSQTDDEMRRFLLGTMEYLNTFIGGNVEVPITIIRAINDVERIAKIEESTFSSETQDVVRLGMLQIARLAGESG